MSDSSRQVEIPLQIMQNHENTIYRVKLYQSIDKKDWEELCWLVIREATRLEDIFLLNPITQGNILHSIIVAHNSDDEAALLLDQIFDAIEAYTITEERKKTIFDFVNHSNKENQIPLEMALGKKFYKVVKKLIRNAAEVSRKAQSLINEENPNLLIAIYDMGITLERNPCDITNTNWWKVDYEYKYITGWPGGNNESDKKYQETRSLATTLFLSREQRTNLMMHPLVQMFVNEKYKRYGFLIKLSMMLHIIWSTMIATYVTCINTLVDEFHSNTNDTNFSTSNKHVEENIEQICVFLELRSRENFLYRGCFVWNLIIFFVCFLIKEMVEVRTCPSRMYYWNQYENIGQWTVFVVLICSVFVLYIPNYTLALPTILVWGLYVRKVCKTWKNCENETYTYQLASMDKYLLVATVILTCVIPEFFMYWWIPFTAVAAYFAVPVLTIILFVISCLVCIWPCGRRRRNIFARHMQNSNFKCTWKKLNCLAQFVGVSIQLGFIAYIPAFESWNNVIASFICAVGIAASLFLVQGQLTKTESYGVYNQMLMKGFKILVPFLFTFFPILVAYLVIFVLLLPSNPNFSLNNGIGLGKIVTMLTGDLGFDDIFSKENIPHVISANIALIMFAVTVVLLLQNLLIGLTVNDLGKLQRNATAAHVANRLEVIYLMEHGIMKYTLGLLERLELKELVIEHLCVGEFVFPNLTQQQPYISVPTQSPERQQNGTKFSKLPKSIRDGIFEKLNLYANDDA